MHFFELSPNCSLTPRSAAFFYLSVLTVSLGTAGPFAVAGFWPILVVAGLELLGLGAALYISLRRGRIREFIRIDEREVLVGLSEDGQRAEHRFARPWTTVRLRKADVPAWPSRLLLGSMGRAVEVGAFLTESERLRLRTRLAQLIPSANPAGGHVVSE